jgi:dTDP-4-amino-4,6-dideoxygalactose transaminase
LNYHKTIQCGEGGVAVTDDPVLAERLALARNHGEAVVDGGGPDDVLGFNHRMGELEAAIAEVQLARLDELTAPRIAHARRLTDGLAGLEGLHAPVVPDGCTHVFYVYAVRVEPALLGVPRARFAAALQAEGIPVVEGYVPPLYRQPVYRRRALACAFACPRYEGEVSYDDGLCPVSERMHERELLFHPLVHAGLAERDVDDVVAAFRKVHAQRGTLGR